MKSILIFISTFLTSYFVAAQGVDFHWAKPLQFSHTVTGMGHYIGADAMGNVYTSGTFYTPQTDFDPGPAVFNLTPHGNNDVFITKYDANGNFVWAVNVGGRRQDISTGLAVDAAGFVYVLGFFEDTADFDPGPAVFNMNSGTTWQDVDTFILKLDPNGNFVWAKQYSGNGEQFSRSIAIDNLGNIYSTGSFNGPTDFDPGTGVFTLSNNGGFNTFIAKLDNAGNFVWAKTNHNPAYFGVDYTTGIAVDPANNVYFTGSFTGTMDFDPGAGTFLMTSPPGQRTSVVTRLDPAGNFQWVANAGLTLFYFGHSIAADASGNVFLIKEQSLCKINATGTVVWTKAMGGKVHDDSQSIYLDGNANVYIAGQFWNTVDFDPGPGIHNVTAFGTPYWHDSYVLRLDNNGNFIWVQQMGGNQEDLGLSLYVDGPGNIYHTGKFSNDADFDPGPPVYPLNVTGTSNYIHKMKKCINVTTSNINATACNTYTLNNQTYTATGTYTQIILNTAGCDSIITLNLTINGSNTTTSVTACDSYTWQGQTYTVSGYYSDTLIANGCDSILNINLTINNSVQSTVSATICQGQVYAGHSTSGIYVDTYVAANGCDSVRTLNLTVTATLFSNISSTICEGQNREGYTLTGVYVDTLVSVYGCDSIRTLNLTVNPRAFTNVNITICEGQSYYAAGANQTTSGIYKDSLLTSLGCDSIITTTLTVNPKPRPNLGPDGNLCTNAQATISPGSFASYQWQDNTTQPIYIVSNPGLYWVKVSDANNCSATDSLTIVAIDTIPRDFLPPHQELCYGDALIITVPGYADYLWSTGSRSGSIPATTFGTYYLTVKDFNNCTGTDSIILTRKNCIPIAVPNAFTPNGDSKNDIFKPTINQAVSNYSFIVFNRYGQKVFETREYGKGWDGRYKDKEQPTGSYVYRISFTNIFGWNAVENGSVLLIR